MAIKSSVNNGNSSAQTLPQVSGNSDKNGKPIRLSEENPLDVSESRCFEPEPQRSYVISEFESSTAHTTVRIRENEALHVDIPESSSYNNAVFSGAENVSVLCGTGNVSLTARLEEDKRTRAILSRSEFSSYSYGGVVGSG